MLREGIWIVRLCYQAIAMKFGVPLVSFRPNCRLSRSSALGLDEPRRLHLHELFGES